MTTPLPNRDASNWAQPVNRLKVGDLPAGAINLNVEGKQLTGPIRGFGQMWQKTYSVRLSGAAAMPAEVIKVWKAEFPNFWPKGNRFYAPLTSIAPGEVAVLNLSVPGGPPVTAVSTGIMVIYADDVSFSFMTPEGHMLAGMITFSAHEEDGGVVAQAQALIRAMDPLIELMFRIGMGSAEDDFWFSTLRSLATRFGVNGNPQLRTTLVDPRVQWSEAKNIWHNSVIRTALYMPAALVKRAFKRG